MSTAAGILDIEGTSSKLQSGRWSAVFRHCKVRSKMGRWGLSDLRALGEGVPGQWRLSSGPAACLAAIWRVRLWHVSGILCCAIIRFYEVVLPQLDIAETGRFTPSDKHSLSVAARHIREGGVVAMPTDTLYGLAADAFNPRAIERVFAVKERPEGMALPVLMYDFSQMSHIASEVTGEVKVLAEAFWPGPLTLVLRRAEALPPRLTAGAPTIAVRIPAHPVPRELARMLGRPITGTSANISGAPDPLDITEVRAQVGNRVDCLIESGPRPAGAASTIVDMSRGAPKLLREGAIPFADIEALLNTR